jgi:hypothetical protein
MPTTTHTVPVPGIDPVAVTVTDYGTGQPFLLLHGVTCGVPELGRSAEHRNPIRLAIARERHP